MKKAILYTALFALLSACGTKPAEQPDTSASVITKEADTISFTKEQIDFAEIEAGSFIDTVLNRNTECVGQVELPPQSLASVSVPLGGFVKEIFVMPNQFVKKGTPLATIANPEYIRVQESFLEYTALCEQLRLEYERQQTLAQHEAASVKKMQQSKADYEVAKAKLQSAEAMLSILGIQKEELKATGIRPYLPLLAPINGYISDLNVNIGLYMEPNKIAFELVEKTQLHLYLSVYEKDMENIRIGDAVQFNLISQPRKQSRATIESIGEKVMSENRTITLIGHIENQNVDLKSGMHVNAEILSAGKTVYALPENAIVNHNNRWYIFTEENGYFQRREVTKGIEQGKLVEISNHDSLPKNPRIITHGAYYIQTEMIKRME